MRTITTSFITLLLISTLYIGCKDNPTAPAPVITPSVDFTITYQFVSDTCYFYCQTTQTVYIDRLRVQYPAQGYDHTFNLDPNTIYNPGQTYIIPFAWVYLVRPADLTFTFTGRWVSNNNSYEVKKDVHIP